MDAVSPIFFLIIVGVSKVLPDLGFKINTLELIASRVLPILATKNCQKSDFRVERVAVRMRQKFEPQILRRFFKFGFDNARVTLRDEDLIQSPQAYFRQVCAR